MNVQNTNWVAIGALNDIPRQAARKVNVGDTTIAVFRTSSDALFAIENKCPHKGGHLSEGIVHGNCVTCPLHNWVISLEDGKAQGADEGAAQTYPVKLENGTVMLGL